MSQGRTLEKKGDEGGCMRGGNTTDNGKEGGGADGWERATHGQWEEGVRVGEGNTMEGKEDGWERATPGTMEGRLETLMSTEGRDGIGGTGQHHGKGRE